MDFDLEQLLELNRDPMLALKDGKVLLCNAAARECFPELTPGVGVGGLLPDHLFSAGSDSFLSTAVIGGLRCTVSVRRQGELLLLVLSPTAPADSLRGCLSDSLMNGMLSALFNIGLAADALNRCAEAAQPEARRSLSVLYRSYYLLNHQLSNLNTLCALSENTMRIVPRRTDLAALCRELAATVQLMTREDCAPLSFSCAAASLPAVVDAPKVERLVLNLLSNSLKHTPKEGQILLRLMKCGDKALLSVDDTGCGIPPERLKTVFTGFEERLNDRNLTLDSTGGLGLGICRALAEKHGGALILESRPAEGTSVRVLLPLTPPGGDTLGMDAPGYDGGGMNLILTELSDVLPAAAYRPEYRE